MIEHGRAAHVFLSGPMGAGKSSVGPRLAALLDRSFVDLDAAIEAEAGMRVAELFRTRGEAVFRRLEADVARRLVAREVPSVFALGGGVVEDAQTRAMLLERGVVVTLTASIDALLARATREGLASRPLLGADAPRAALSRILERRAAAYAEAHRVIDTSDASVEEVARGIAAHHALDARSVCVRLGLRSHRVVIASGAAAGLAQELEALEAQRIVVVTDTNVAPWATRWLAPLAVEKVVVTLAPGETHKTLASLERIWDAALAAHADRRTVVVAIGGGVVGDLAGFAAATLLRGVRVVQVPTSLLAMVDSSVGGKTGIDRAQGKNLVGAFHQPSVVLCDVDALSTLPPRELAAGLAEVVKTAWIEGEADVAALEADAGVLLTADPAADAARERAVRRSVRTKARIVASDEHEAGPRRLLNLGHTLGHVVEAASGYSLVHGEAVSIGLVAALRLSRERGLATDDDVRRLESLLERFGLPTVWPDLDGGAAARWLAADKKAQGKAVHFITAGAPGSAAGLAVAQAEVLAFVDRLAAR